MSALGGICLFSEEALVDGRDLARVSELLRLRGPDGGRDFIAGRVGFCYRASHTNRESRLEDQPLISSEGHILAWDGRLDNRREVADLIGGAVRKSDQRVTDVEIVMEAYRKFGEGFASKLVGDFALSLWDSHARKLLLARDHVGVRTLYYRVEAERVLWSSDLTALFYVCSAKVEIDEDYIAGFLAFDRDPGRTPFKGINSVLPGHLVAIDHCGILRDSAYWKLNPKARIRFQNDKGYEEQFRNLLEESVASRLRCDRTVFAELSGGLDSSTITCVADQLIKAGRVQAPGVETVSHVTEESRSSDERKFIRYVEEKVGRQSNYVFEEQHPYLTLMREPPPMSTINPLLVSSGYPRVVEKLMREKGSRVLLSGLGGDELLHSINDPTPELSDLMVGWRFIELWKRLSLWSNLLREPYAHLFWRACVIPNLPLGVQVYFKRGRRFNVPEWVNKEFAKRTNLRMRCSGTRDIYGFRRPSGRDQSIGFLSVANIVALGHHAEACCHERSYPFLDRRLVEFLCAIPFEQLLRPGESRSLMRRALVDVLPEATIKRRGKGSPREIVSKGFGRAWPQWGHLFDEPLVVKYGFMELRPLAEALRRARHGMVDEISMLVLVITLELWLRNLGARRPPVVGEAAAGLARERIAAAGYLGIPGSTA